MEKRELLKLIGFSDEYLNELEEHEKKGFESIKLPHKQNESFDFSNHDTSDYNLEAFKQTDTTDLIYEGEDE